MGKLVTSFKLTLTFMNAVWSTTRLSRPVSASFRVMMSKTKVQSHLNCSSGKKTEQTIEWYQNFLLTFATINGYTVK